MPDDVKILTVVLDDGELVVDYSGMSVYEAYGLLCGASALIQYEVEETDDADPDGS